MGAGVGRIAYRSWPRRDAHSPAHGGAPLPPSPAARGGLAGPNLLVQSGSSRSVACLEVRAACVARLTLHRPCHSEGRPPGAGCSRSWGRGEKSVTVRCGVWSGPVRRPTRPDPREDGGHLGVSASHVGEHDEEERPVGLPAERRPTFPTVARRVAVTRTTGTVVGVPTLPPAPPVDPQRHRTPPIDVTSDGASSNGWPMGTARTKCRKCRMSDTAGAWFLIPRPTATHPGRGRRASVGSVGQAQRVTTTDAAWLSAAIAAIRGATGAVGPNTETTGLMTATSRPGASAVRRGSGRPSGDWPARHPPAVNRWVEGLNPSRTGREDPTGGGHGNVKL